MYVERNLEEKIEKYLKSPEIIAIVGPRQSGKTTLLLRIYSKYRENSSYITFEDPEALGIFEQNYSDFLNLYVKGKKMLFIDEFQYAKSGGKILKQIYDSHKIKIFVSGSSSAELTVKALKHLVGRIFTFELFPFDFEEFLRARNRDLCKFYQERVRAKIDKLKSLSKLDFDSMAGEKIRRYFEEYIIYGGYPRVVLASDLEEKKEILKNIYSTFFLREVKDYLGLVDDYKLHKLLKALSLQIGNLIEYKELSSTSEYSFTSLKKYLNFLEKTYVACLVRPFFRNKRKEIVKNPKIYFLDTGLRNCVVKDFRRLDLRPDSGSLLENIVFINLRKKGLDLKYWRNKKKREVDFIIEDTFPKIAMEIRTSINKCKKSHSVDDFLTRYQGFVLFFLYYKGFEKMAKSKAGKAGIFRFPCFMI